MQNVVVLEFRMQPENIRAVATTIQTLHEARSAVAKKASTTAFI